MAVVRDIEPWDELLAAGREDEPQEEEPAEEEPEPEAEEAPKPKPKKARVKKPAASDSA